MTTATTTRTIVIVGGREHHVLEGSETILAMLDRDAENTFLRLTNVYDAPIWVRRSLVSAFIEGDAA